MAASKILRSVLWDFLGAFTSRYSEFEGYWLPGFLVRDFDTLDFDLLTAHVGGDRPLDVARRLAETKFADQLQKAGIERDGVRIARLTMTRSDSLRRGTAQSLQVVRPHAEWAAVDRDGYDVLFRAEAELSDGIRFAVDRTIFAAAHDPALESSSARNALRPPGA